MGDIKSLMNSYPLEWHKVETKDAYILTVHRIPGVPIRVPVAASSSYAIPEIQRSPPIKPIKPMKERHIAPLPLPLPLPLPQLPRPQLGRKMMGGSRPPVFLIHGISLSSTCWVVNSPEQSLGFILADAGYDVWMHNTRGNTFSRGHKTLKDTDSAFWDFSMDEMALMDLPAVIDYILKATGAKKLPLVSHSQGSTLTFMLLASLPEYNDKFQVHIAMAPVAYVKLMTSQMMSAFCSAGNLEALKQLPPSEYFIMSPQLQNLVLNGACQTSLMLPICLGIVQSLFGSSDHISSQDHQRLFLNWPSSTSFDNVLHWSQMWQQDRPRLTKFNSNQEYDLRQIKARHVLLSGGVDVLAPPSNIDLIKRNLKASEVVDIDLSMIVGSYGHMEWIWSADAKDLAYPTVIKSLSKYSS